MLRKQKANVFIGTSGWSYEHWKGNFYPLNLKSNDWLAHYAKALKTVEINTTFYHTPKLTTIKNWYNHVPEDFSFAIKMSGYITHRKRLIDCQENLEYFHKNIKEFKAKTGPILVQLPPSFKINTERLEKFISFLIKKYRYTFEFRHESWFCDEIFELLTKHNMALCITDLHGHPSPEWVTADFVYIRLHGPQNAYSGSYSTSKLKVWKKKIEQWLSLASVYCYFDNDEKGFAVKDAQTLQNLIG